MEDSIKVTENDIQFIKKVVDLDANIKKCQNYIKENFNIDSDFDPETSSVKLYCNNAEESLALLAAKDYIYESIARDFVEVTY